MMQGNYDRVLQSNVSTMYSNLKLYGAQLEELYKDFLDRYLKHLIQFFSITNMLFYRTCIIKVWRGFILTKHLNTFMCAKIVYIVFEIPIQK